MNLQDVLDKQVHLRGVPAVVAGLSAAGTRSVATRGAVQVTSDSCFRIASLTKTLTSTALVLTLREHDVPLSTPAIELLPDLAPDWRADASLTVEQILGQVSGLRESVDSTAVAALGDGRHALNEAARLVVRAGNEQEPGAHWSYYNGNYFLAGAILAALDGASYETALKKKLLEPWHLSRTSFDAPRDSVTGWDGSTELHEAITHTRAAPAEACGRASRTSWHLAKDCSATGPFWRTFADRALGRTTP